MELHGHAVVRPVGRLSVQWMPLGLPPALGQLLLHAVGAGRWCRAFALLVLLAAFLLVGAADALQLYRNAVVRPVVGRLGVLWMPLGLPPAVAPMPLGAGAAGQMHVDRAVLFALLLVAQLLVHAGDAMELDRIAVRWPVAGRSGALWMPLVLPPAMVRLPMDVDAAGRLPGDLAVLFLLLVDAVDAMELYRYAVVPPTGVLWMPLAPVAALVLLLLGSSMRRGATSPPRPSEPPSASESVSRGGGLQGFAGPWAGSPCC
jgi:hypothetical protein